MVLLQQIQFIIRLFALKFQLLYLDLSLVQLDDLGIATVLRLFEERF